MADGTSGYRSVRIRIEGRVQGVGFRYWVENTAVGIGLVGWVRNRRDASVEAAFGGPAARVTEMVMRCRTGPPAARVSAVTILEEGVIVHRGFEVLPTQ